MNTELDESYLLALKAKPFKLETLDQQKLLKHAIYFFFQNCKNHEVAELIFELLEKGHQAPIEFCEQVVLTFIHSTEQFQTEEAHEQIILKVIQQLLGKFYFFPKFGELRPKSQCALHVILHSLQSLDDWIWTNENSEAFGAFIEAAEVDNVGTATMIIDAVNMIQMNADLGDKRHLLLKPILMLLSRTEGIWTQEDIQLTLLDAALPLSKYDPKYPPYTVDQSVVLIKLVDECLKRISNAEHQESYLIFLYAYNNVYEVATAASKENKGISDPLLMIELVRKVTPVMIPLTRTEDEHFEKNKKHYLAYEQWVPASAIMQDDVSDLRALSEPSYDSRCVKALEMLLMMSHISYTTAADIMIPKALELANSSDFRVVEGAMRIIHIIAVESRSYYPLDREAISQLLVSKMRAKNYNSVKEEVEDQVVRCAACYALAALERQLLRSNAMLMICQELGSSPVSPIFMNTALHACLRVIAHNRYQISYQDVHGCLEALNTCLSRNIKHLANYRLMCDALKDIYCSPDLSPLPSSLTKKLLDSLSLQRFASLERQYSFFKVLANITNLSHAPEMKDLHHHILKSYLLPTLTSRIGFMDSAELAPVIECYGDCISELGDESLPYINEKIFKALIGMLHPQYFSTTIVLALRVFRWCSWLLSLPPSQRHNLEWIDAFVPELFQQLVALVPNPWLDVDDNALVCFGNFAMKLPQSTVLSFADSFLESICSRSSIEYRLYHVIAQLATVIPEHTASKTSRLFPILYNSQKYLTSADYTPLLLQGVLNMIRLNLSVGFFAADERDYQFPNTETMNLILSNAEYKEYSSNFRNSFKRSPRYSPRSPTYYPGLLTSLDVCPTPSIGLDSPSMNKQTQEAPKSPEYPRTPSPQYDISSPTYQPTSPQYLPYSYDDNNNNEEVGSPSRKRQRTEENTNETATNVARACWFLMKFQFDAIPYSLKYQIAQVLLQFKFRMPRRFWESHIVWLPEMRMYLNLVSIFNAVPLVLTDIKLQTFK